MDKIKFSEEMVIAEKTERDIEKGYSLQGFVEKLRRLADALEAGKRFEIQVAGERIYVPADAEISIEHERGEGEEELEFQLKWEYDAADEEIEETEESEESEEPGES